MPSTIFNTPKPAFYKAFRVYQQNFKDCIQFNQQSTVDNFFMNNVGISTVLPCQEKFYPQLSTVLLKNPVKSTLLRFFVENLSKNKRILLKNQQDCKLIILCIKKILIFINHRNYHYFYQLIPYFCIYNTLFVNSCMIIIKPVSFMDNPLTIHTLSNSNCTVQLLAILPEIFNLSFFQN